jgi:mono/diheme cytochrome c family protein
VSSRRLRLIAIPAALFLVASGATFALAKAHLAKPGVPKLAAGAQVQLGDPYRGATSFQKFCAPCHGANGKGGGIGPRLADLALPLAAAKAQIDNGGGTMPPHVVTGRDEEDVLAYLATILKSP